MQYESHISSRKSLNNETYSLNTELIFMQKIKYILINANKRNLKIKVTYHFPKARGYLGLCQPLPDKNCISSCQVPEKYIFLLDSVLHEFSFDLFACCVRQPIGPTPLGRLIQKCRRVRKLWRTQQFLFIYSICCYNTCQIAAKLYLTCRSKQSQCS